EMPLAALYPLERLALGISQRTVESHLQQLHVPTDRVERRAKLVAHHREKVALRAARRVRGPQRVAQLALEPAAAPNLGFQSQRPLLEQRELERTGAVAH